MPQSHLALFDDDGQIKTLDVLKEDSKESFERKVALMDYSDVGFVVGC